ncbi:hypothetical protein SAMN05421505_101220 [Sinosporangium album]|uniref:Uncharacterized protein n=1 Tax=Sinosporangium album TaxID=504805 RepID=A0A1G7R292_9ACTN|nr:hypothetical protein [Sinosporangium album]SDG04896.1 hypothetical protein SAMN05421505_101220 [Sinosporangium album]
MFQLTALLMADEQQPHKTDTAFLENYAVVLREWGVRARLTSDRLCVYSFLSGSLEAVVTVDHAREGLVYRYTPADSDRAHRVISVAKFREITTYAPMTLPGVLPYNREVPAPWPLCSRAREGWVCGAVYASTCPARAIDGGGR